MFIVVKFQNKFNLAALLVLILNLSLLMVPAVRAEGINENAEQIIGISPSCSSDKDSMIGEVDKCGENSDETKAEEKSPISSQPQPIEENAVIIDAAPETENYQSMLPAEASEDLGLNDIDANSTEVTKSIPTTILSVKTAHNRISYLPTVSNACSLAID